MKKFGERMNAIPMESVGSRCQGRPEILRYLSIARYASSGIVDGKGLVETN
jgi:hypothetical protein